MDHLTSGPFIAGIYIETRQFARSIRRVYGLFTLLLGAAGYAAFFVVVHDHGRLSVLPVVPTVLFVVAIGALITPLHTYPHVPDSARTNWILASPGGERAAVAGRMLVSTVFCIVDVVLAMAFYAVRDGHLYSSAAAWTIGTSVSAVAFRQVWYFTGRHLPGKRLIRWIVAGASALGLWASLTVGGAHRPIGPAGAAAALVAGVALAALAWALATSYLDEAVAADERRSGRLAGTALSAQRSYGAGDRWAGDRAFVWLELISTRRALRRLPSTSLIPLVPGLIAIAAVPAHPGLWPLICPFFLAQIGGLGMEGRDSVGRALREAEHLPRAALWVALGRAPWFLTILWLASIPALVLSAERAELAAALLIAVPAAAAVALLHATEAVWGDRWRTLHWAILPPFAAATAATAWATDCGVRLSALTLLPVLVCCILLALLRRRGPESALTSRRTEQQTTTGS